MILNYVWVAFFLIAFVIAVFQLLFNGNTEIFSNLMNAAFSSAKTAFEISIGLTGVLTMWLGIMKVGEKGGMVNVLAKIFKPFFKKLYPELPKDHPAHGSIIMNFVSNMLQLDNAATPLGLKAMKEMQESNPTKEIASNSQIMFLALNTAGFTLIPVSIMVYRAQMGAANPADVFIPLLITTFVAFVTAIAVTSIYQKINIFNWTILAYILSFASLLGSIMWYFSGLTQIQISKVSSFAAGFIIFSIIISFILLALKKKINVYDEFIEGAKEGFSIAIKIIPYLVAMLIAIGIFRASGALDYFINALAYLLGLAGINTDFVAALPTAIMKPLSGSGARGMMVETMKTYGADSFSGRLACLFQGTTDTTFFILALYFGTVGVKNTRYAIVCGLLTDLAGVLTAIGVGYLFFH